MIMNKIIRFLRIQYLSLPLSTLLIQVFQLTAILILVETLILVVLNLFTAGTEDYSLLGILKETGIFEQNPAIIIGAFGFLLILSLFIGFIEELVFRGIIYRIIRKRLNVAYAIFLSSLIFVSIHFFSSPYLDTFLVISFFSVLITYNYEKKHSLLIISLVHALQDPYIVVIANIFSSNIVQLIK